MSSRPRKTSAGPNLSISDTQALGSSIWIGKAYRFDVYGWDGMLGIRRDIMHATSLTP